MEGLASNADVEMPWPGWLGPATAGSIQVDAVLHRHCRALKLSASNLLQERSPFAGKKLVHRPAFLHVMWGKISFGVKLVDEGVAVNSAGSCRLPWRMPPWSRRSVATILG